MSRLKFKTIFVLAISMFALQSCFKDKCTQKYTHIKYTPIYQTNDDIFKQVGYGAAQEISDAGRIYFFNQYILINEKEKGLHVINNQDPSNPVNEGFISIPGNFNMAVQGKFLYADCYTHLLTINVEDLNNIFITDTELGVFPYSDWFGNTVYDSEKGLLTGYETEDVTEEVDYKCGGYYKTYCHQCDLIAFNSASIAESSTALNSSLDNFGGNELGVGVGGSMAQFSLVQGNLYIVDIMSLSLYNINGNQLEKGTDITLDFGVETIFPYENMLFLGTQTGMHIFDNSNPNNPVQLSTYEHVRSCDPVVVQDNLAYVTLRSGTECQGFTNQLEVIDISDPSNPNLIATHEMFNPHGLGIDGSTLFICDGEDGLKVFDASNPQTIGQNLILHRNDINAFDVIPLGNYMVLTGNDGLFQYDYSNPSNIELLSSLWY